MNHSIFKVMVLICQGILAFHEIKKPALGLKRYSMVRQVYTTCVFAGLDEGVRSDSFFNTIHL